MTEPDFDALTARVFATEDGKRWVAEMGRRSNLFGWLAAEIAARVGRERERWRTGELTPG